MTQGNITAMKSKSERVPLSPISAKSSPKTTTKGSQNKNTKKRKNELTSYSKGNPKSNNP